MSPNPPKHVPMDGGDTLLDAKGLCAWYGAAQILYDVDLQVRSTDTGEVFFEVTMHDAWVWDMYRPARFVKNVRVVTFKDVNIEELAKSDLELPEDNKLGFSG